MMMSQQLGIGCNVKNDFSSDSTSPIGRQAGRTVVKGLAAALASAWLLCGCVTTKELDQARTMRSGDLQNKIQALALCDTALSKASAAAQKQEVSTLANAIRVDITDEVIKKADAAKGASPTVPSLEQARAVLKEYAKYDDAAGRIKKALDELTKSQTTIKAACQQNLDLSKKAEDAKDWSQALTRVQKAAELDPTAISLNTEQKRIVEVRDLFYESSLKAALDQEKLEEAMGLLKAFLAESPAPAATLIQRIQKGTEATSDKIAVRQIKAAVEANKFYTAFKLMGRLYDPAGVPDRAGIIERGAAYYLQKARAEMDVTNRIGYAYFAAVKALEMKPSDATIFGIHRDYSDILKKLTRVQIAVSTFDSPAKEPDAGKQFSEALLAKLQENLPFGIDILERSKIDEVLKEKGRQLRELSEELKVEMFIVGNVSTLEVEHQRSEQESTLSIHTDTRKETNPAYTEMMMRYGANVRKWPYTPPATIDTPISQVVKYKMGQERVKGLMVVSARIFDTAKGAVTVAKEFKTTEDAEDKFCDAVPSAKIEADPLNIPSDIETKEKMRQVLVKQVAEVIFNAYEAREDRFWKAAEWSLGRQEVDKAVLDLARGYYYCLMEGNLKGGRENNASCLKITEAGLLKYTE